MTQKLSAWIPDIFRKATVYLGKAGGPDRDVVVAWGPMKAHGTWPSGSVKQELDYIVKSMLWRAFRKYEYEIEEAVRKNKTVVEREETDLQGFYEEL